MPIFVNPLVAGQAIGNVISTGSYYGPPGANNTTRSCANNREWAVPFFVPKTVTVTNIGGELTTAGAGAAPVVRYGIRPDNGVGHPSDSVLLDTGATVGISTGDGAVGAKEYSGLTTVLTPGLYWLTLTPQGSSTTAPVFRALTGTQLPVKATSIVNLAAQSNSGYFQDGVTGALGTFAGTAVGTPPFVAVKL